MVPSRGKGKVRGESSASRVPTSAPRTMRRGKKAVPDVYQDMLAEATDDRSADGDSDRALKKRRVMTGVSIPSPQPPEGSGSKGAKVSRKQHALAAGDDGEGRNVHESQQIVQQLSASDDDDESDFDFEDVDLEQPTASSPAQAEHNGEIADVSVSISSTTTPKGSGTTRQRPATTAEKALRLLLHKAHFLCLLGHCLYVNSWCNNEVVQRHFRPLFSMKTLSYLKSKADDSQFQRNRSFMDGLQQASEAFRSVFTITASGMRRAKWAPEGHADSAASGTEPMDRSDFIQAARDLEGSQDTANQLFCALLRSAGVEARLVCSLQPLPFAYSSTKTSTPQKVMKPTIFAMASSTDCAASDSNMEDSSIKSSAKVGKVPSVRRRLGQTSLPLEPAMIIPPKEKKAIRKLSYPIFWVEAFNTAHQKWIPVDPTVTQTINKPSKLEPPGSYEPNQMSYALAFESDGVVKDVTRRYARAYNAKTRRNRVEATEGGDRWLKQALRILRRRGGLLDRDQVEDAELAAKEAREGLPTNVQDFKDHPVYALERHLRRHEVLLGSKREVGKVNAGTAARPRMESVFRRRDVVVCRSADKWYRLCGRVVREGEHPVKHVPARHSRRARSPLGVTDAQDEDEEKSMTALYAPFQTDLYIPPPVSDGRIIKNAYGNLDIYTPSMVPAGGSHVRHPLAQQAAKILRVDYADAVTGFQFKGRQGTAVMDGVVVASECAEGVRAVIEGLTDEKMEEESLARSVVALRMWKRLLVGLRIKDRVGEAYGGREDEVLDDVMEEEDELAEAGGFLPGEAGDNEVALPTAGRFSLEQVSAHAKPKRKKPRREVNDDEDESAEAEFSDAGSLTTREDEQYHPTTRARRGMPKVFEDEDEDEDEDGDEKERMLDVARSSPEPQSGHEDEALMPVENDAGGGFLLEDAAGEIAGDAGGFLPDDDHGGGGGGFFPDEAEKESTEQGGGFIVEEDSRKHAGAINGPEATDAEMRMSGALPDDVADDTNADAESDNGLAGGHSFELPISAADDILVSVRNVPNAQGGNYTDVRESKAAADDAGMPNRKDEQGTSKANVQAAEKRTMSDAADETMEADDSEGGENDRGSMMSHDPSDDDAEPDWLESD